MAKHSNVYYIFTNNSFQAVEHARAYKNNYGLDLFTHDEKVYEGRSGLIVVNSKTAANFETKLASNGGIDRLNELINAQIARTGESPRYTQPNERKDELFPPREKDEDVILAMDAYDKMKHFYRRFHIEHDIALYTLKNEDDEHRMVYAECESYMLALDHHHRLDEIKKWLAGLENGIKSEVERLFNQSLTNPQKYANYAHANILNRFDEAKAHNEPILEARRHENEKRDEEYKEKLAEQENEAKERYAHAIKAAEQGIMNRHKVHNSEIDGKSLIMQLFREHEISVPLKTQGWIIGSLYDIYFDAKDDEWTYQYYKTSKNSTVFQKYLLLLVEAVNSKKHTEEADSL